MTGATEGSLGAYLSSLRAFKGLTLRQVQELTAGTVSNAYLSQVENNKIKKPSPNVLHALSEVYGASYSDLMEKAGYVSESGSRRDEEKHGRLATFADESLTKEEEEELLEYLAFLRTRRRKSSGK